MLTKKNASTILVLVGLLGAGFWLRTLHPGSPLWAKTTMVTLYFADGPFFFPVSRRMPTSDELPRAALQALLDGPSSRSSLKNPIPRGVEIRSFKLTGGTAHIDLSGAVLDDRARTAIVETMTALSGVTSVTLRVEGKLLADGARRIPLLYYASANGLVATAVTAANPRAALDMYLSSPAASQWTVLPSDARLLAYDYDQADGLVSLKFVYTPAVRALALERPEQVRLLLLGLITSLTEFPEVRSVQLDFGGQSRLGLGRCSDLLGAPQPRPELLNDERLL